MDTFIFRLINNFSGRFFLIDWLGIFLAKSLIYFLIAFFLWIVLGEPEWRRRYHLFFLAGLSALLSRGIITEAIRFFYHRPRPFEALNLTPLFTEASGNSFPSGHATLAFALAFVVYYFFQKTATERSRRWAIWFLTAAAVIGLGRVFGGVHWPSDILGGAAIAYISVILVRRLLPSAPVSDKQP